MQLPQGTIFRIEAICVDTLRLVFIGVGAYKQQACFRRRGHPKLHLVAGQLRLRRVAQRHGFPVTRCYPPGLVPVPDTNIEIAKTRCCFLRIRFRSRKRRLHYPSIVDANISDSDRPDG